MAGKKKKKTKKKKTTSWKKRLIRYLLGLFALGLLLMGSLILLVYLGAYGKLPDKEAIMSIRQDNASLVYASDGSLMGKYFIVNRESIENENISPHVRHALIATEDNRFFEHHGIDLISLGRVMIKSILMGDLDQGGGSTISQQLAKNLFPRKSHGFLTIPVSKVREMFIASEIEDIYSKEEILTMYLNTVSFGENVYGIEAAARRFFSKSSAELSIPESATLIGMLAANTAYNPRINPENALKRRNIVLGRMHTQGFISEEQLKKTSSEPIMLRYRIMDHSRGVAPYFREYIRKQIIDLTGDSIELETSGLKIFTTINSRIQAYAEEAIDRQMRKLQKEFDAHWKNKDPWDADPGLFRKALEETEAYRKLSGRSLSHEQILSELSRKHNRKILTADGIREMEISTIDSLRHYMRLLNTGFLALDPGTGAILAWAGGIDYQYLPYDHVLSKRQAGSTFKPFVYAAALEQGMSPCRFISNSQRVYEDYDNWSPGNSNGNYNGYFSMAGGLMNSVNTITAEVMMETGPEDVAALARGMGVRSTLPAVPSLALGTADVSLLEIVTAYTGFANSGVSVEPFGILRIEDNEGHILYEAKEAERLPPAFSKETGILMSQMLQGVVDSGTAASARSIYGVRSRLAGKTGTTQNNADGWFIGYTPAFVAGVWVGAELPTVHFRTTALGSGSHMALPIFAMTAHAMENDPGLRTKYLLPFPAIPDTLAAMLDCPAFSRELPLEYLTRKEKREFRREIREKEALEKDSSKEKKGFFRKVRDFFRRKDK